MKTPILNQEIEEMENLKRERNLSLYGEDMLKEYKEIKEKLNKPLNK